MSSLDIHLKKYEMFKKDASNENNSHMTRIEALFEASFHLIESCCALHRIHINKHQLVRQFMEDNESIFQDQAALIWQKFQEMENQIRPGQLYGGKINGEQLKKSLELFSLIEGACLPILRTEKDL